MSLIGVFMRDVTLCNYGNPKKLRNGLYNFSKLRILVQMVNKISEENEFLQNINILQFEEIYQYQKSNHYFPSDDRTQIYCSNLHSLEEHEYVMTNSIVCKYLIFCTTMLQMFVVVLSLWTYPSAPHFTNFQNLWDVISL